MSRFRKVTQGPPHVKTKAADLIMTNRKGTQINQFRKQFQKPDPDHWNFFKGVVSSIGRLFIKPK